jgi:hypothetical protein
MRKSVFKALLSIPLFARYKRYCGSDINPYENVNLRDEMGRIETLSNRWVELFVHLSLEAAALPLFIADLLLPLISVRITYQ